MRAEDVLEIILTTKIIAVIRMSDPGKVMAVVEAIRRGGVRAIEITMTTPSALEVIARLAADRPAGTLVGAGTVLDAETADRVVDAGAEFVVSPTTNAGMIAACKRRNIFVAPGAFTPTEILAAWEKGADVVKVFPAGPVGPAYFRDLRGPFLQVRLMPTGGVTLANACEFIRSGACCVAIGTALLDKETIASGDWAGLTTKAKDLVESLN